jgi:hypothetical protein
MHALVGSMARSNAPPAICLVLALVGAALLACKGGSGGAITQPKLGTLTGSAQSPQLASEVTRLPRVPSKSGEVSKNFGICFHYKQPSQLGELTVVVQPPGTIKTDNVQLDKEKAGGGLRMKLPRLDGTEGDFCQEMFFDADDPLGKWHFELRNDEAVVRAWDIDVYAP